MALDFGALEGVPAKIFAYSIPQMGHLNPVMEICAALVQRGHSVTFASAACWRGRLEEKATKMGVEFIGLENGFTDEYCRSFGADHPGFVETGDKDRPLPIDPVTSHKPDVLLTDFASVAAMRVAKEKHIPVIVNCPCQVCPLVTLMPKLQNVLARAVAKFVLPFPKEIVSLFGKEICPNLQHTMVLVNSAWGVERPLALTPNFVMTGPLAPRGQSAKRLAAESHSDLMAFLERAGDKPVAYITTGSLLDLTDIQVKNLFEGFNGYDCFVVWSLKEAQQKLLPSPVPDKFYVNKWIPQIELMAEHKLKFVLTHCGWGGTLECMQFAKPVIGFPGFGDQHDNATLLETQGCGLQLDPKKFTPADVQKVVGEILENHEKFTAKCKFMQNALLATRGATLACETIECVIAHGMSRLFEDKPLHLQ